MESISKPTWALSLEKSILNNRQIHFYNLIFLSYFNATTNQAELESFYFKFFNQNNFIFTIDKRTELFHILVKNISCELGWFFNLSREKYRIKGKINILPRITEENLDLFAKTWDSLSVEEKKSFHQPISNCLTVEKPLLYDIDKFNSPDKVEISENFCILEVLPFEVEHNILIMPQVVADGKRLKFESLMQPYKKPTKYLHKLENEEWKTIVLNP